MGFRDDRDAWRAEAEQLRSERDRAEADLAHSEQARSSAAAEAASLRSRLDQAERKLSRRAAPRKFPRGLWVNSPMGVITLVFVVAVAAALLLLPRCSRAPEPPEQTLDP